MTVEKLTPEVIAASFNIANILEDEATRDELWFLIRELRDENKKMREALQWFINEDETNEGDIPLPDHGGRTWDEINEYWITEKRKAQALLVKEAYDVWFRARLKSVLDNPGELIPNDEVFRRLREILQETTEDESE